MACDMPELCKFSSLDSCPKRFLWTHKEVDLASHPVVGVVLQVGDAEKFPRALGFKILDPFLRASEQGPCFTAVEEDGSDKRLVQLELPCEADGVASLDPVYSDYCCHCRGNSNADICRVGAIRAQKCSYVPDTGHLF